MNQSTLDFRFAWRWLLPMLRGTSVLLGATEEQARYWRDVFPMLNWVQPAGEVPWSEASNYVVLDDNMPSLHAKLADAILSDRQPVVNAEVFCVIANRGLSARWRAWMRRDFPAVHEYALLPASNPRVVVPLSYRHHTALALSLHCPGRWVARQGVMLASTLTRCRNFYLLRGRVLLIASRSPGFIPRGAIQAGVSERIGHQVIDYALYLGTPDDNRKTVVLLLGDEPCGVILKVAETPKSRASLQNEAAALSVLSGSPISRFVPRLVDIATSETAVTLYQEYRPRRRVSARKLDNAVAEFLGQLALVEKSAVPLADYLASVPACPGDPSQGKVASACWALREHLQRLGESGQLIGLHRSHGDFAPWNCAYSEQGLFVFDWEASEAQGLALGDAFYYAIAPALWVQRNPKAESTLAAALSWGRRVAHKVPDSGDGHLNTKIYLALWLLGRQDKAGLSGELLVLLAGSWR